MRAAAFLSVLLVALAGCSDGGSDPEPAAPEPGPEAPPPETTTPEPSAPPEPVTEVPLLIDFDALDCTGLSFHVQAQPETVAALLPDGYSVPGTGLATVTATLQQCASFDAVGQSFPDVWFGHVTTPVTAPDHVAQDAADQRYLFETIGGDDLLAILWPAAGFPITNGTVESSSPGPGIHTLDAGAYGWEIVAPPAPQDTGSASFAWYHQLSNGNTNVWTGHRSEPAASSGSGTLDVPAESAVAAADPLGAPLGFIAGAGTHIEGADYEDMFLVQHLPETL